MSNVYSLVAMFHIVAAANNPTSANCQKAAVELAKVAVDAAKITPYTGDGRETCKVPVHYDEDMDAIKAFKESCKNFKRSK